MYNIICKMGLERLVTRVGARAGLGGCHGSLPAERGGGAQVEYAVHSRRAVAVHLAWADLAVASSYLPSWTGERSTAIRIWRIIRSLLRTCSIGPGVCLAGLSGGRKGSPTTRSRAPAVVTRLASVNAVEELWLATRMTSRLEALKVGVGQ